MVTIEPEPFDFEGKPYWRVVSRTDLTDLIAIPNMDNIVPIMGKDPANRFQVAYVLYDASLWSRESLENNELLGKMLSECKLCASLNGIQDVSYDTPPAPEPVHPQPPMRSDKIIPQHNVGEGVYARRVTMGDMVAPPALSGAIKVGQSLFCTTMGKAISSGIAALFFDWLGGRASDEGLRTTFLSLADEFIDDFDISEDDKALAMNDLKRAYELWKKDKPMAIKAGLLQNPIEVAAQVFKTTDASDPKKTTTTVGFKGQAFRSSDLVQ